ncbi:MAG: type II secretion system protein N [Pseudomonadota bacterium]
MTGLRRFSLGVIGAAVFVATLIASAPASLIAPALASSGGRVHYAGIEGTIWRGRILGAQVEHVSLGDVAFRLSPLSLVTLSPRATVDLAGGAVVGDADVAVGFGRRVHVRDAKLAFDLARLARRGILGEAVTGRADLTVRDLMFGADGCVRADADIWTDVLSAQARRYGQGDEFPMVGAAACDGARLALSMNGEGDAGAAALEISVAPDYTYEISATAQPVGDDIVAALLYFGFENDNGALIYGSTGVLSGAGS